MIASKSHEHAVCHTRPRKLLNFFAPAVIFSAAAVLTSVVLVAPSAHAQSFGQRVIQGIVSENDAHAVGATVFLKNLKTRDIKSYTSTPDGAFRFTQVGMVDDYEVWAERGKKKSAVKAVSSFDSRKQIDLELKLK